MQDTFQWEVLSVHQQTQNKHISEQVHLQNQAWSVMKQEVTTAAFYSFSSKKICQVNGTCIPCY